MLGHFWIHLHALLNFQDTYDPYLLKNCLDFEKLFEKKHGNLKNASSRKQTSY